MGGVTATTFGLLIAYLLPGFITLFGLTFWSPTVSRVFSTFLTAQSNVGLLLLLLLAGLTAGLFAGMIRWLLLDSLLCRSLFRKERHWLRRWKSPVVLPPSAADYSNLASENRIVAYRAFIEETYRYYQFWGGSVIAMPLLLVGWLRSFEESFTGLDIIGLMLLCLATEGLILIKSLDAWVSVARGHRSILKGEDSGDE